ncbi:ATP-binding cassette sub-family F member 3-like [Saccoglossus kowalevskii]|uniref:ATP-binding cassette sub-family F member 3-like n=1 Tax=Saccoglossus kowalevskii TaxID=10224 RepID=A0ABM0GRZ9_SACKO|nr:PREDICTED: ATP-binding cassette sub-family F member 3-like [Saccoglossus kowalevskii]
MATCSEILTRSFPKIDTELFQYVTGILNGGTEDFNSSDDVYDAIGDVLKEVDEGKSDNEIRNICKRLLNCMTLADDFSDNVNGVLLLDTPVHLGEIAQKQEETVHGHGIWMVQKDSYSVVDKKRLEKAEAKIKAKQERRSQKEDTVKPGYSVGAEASASQVIDRKEAKLDSAGGKTRDIRIEDFDIAFGDKVLMKGANLNLIYGRRYGLVGRNGLGKSTLLKLIACGDLKIPSHVDILHVEQEVVGDDTLALDSVLECDEVRASLLKEEKELNDKIQATSPGSTESCLSTRLSQIYTKLEDIDADKAPSRASVILAGLGFSTHMQSQKTREFSGGWRMRLALARALFSRPDLLLLDEPTNMLDLKAILWLENYLQGWPTTLLVVSHDRNFLNAVATDIIHLHSQKLETYKGDYELFVKTKTEKLKNQQREYESQMKEREHIQAFIDRFRYNANRAALVQSKIKLLERMPHITPVEKESEVILRFAEVNEKLSPPILQLDEVKFYYSEDKPIFNSIDVSANLESRICIVGENGTGKTTLLKILLGDLSPVKGIRHAHRNLQIGYFSQHHVDQLDMDMTSLEVMSTKFPGKTVEMYRHALGGFGISGDLALRPVSSLSGGQKSRVAFAILSMLRPNFFILDEPTNHLDMETIEALGKVLNKFQGGVILVSHDERLITMICKELWVCGNGTVKRVEGGFAEYKQILEEEFASQ